MKVTILKKLPKYQILEFFKNLNTRDTFGCWLIRCANMKIRLVFWKTESGHDYVHRRTGGRTDGHGQVKPSPLNFVEAEGIKPFALHIGSIIIQLCHNYTHTTAAIVICTNYYLIGWRESKLKQNFTIFHMSFIIFELFTHKAFLQWLLNVWSSFVFVADRDMQIYCCLCLLCLW